MNLKQHLRWVVCLATIVMIQSPTSNAAHAKPSVSPGSPADSVGPGVPGMGGGGEIPTPFEAFNQRVELADGEVYTLVGRVVSGRELQRRSVTPPPVAGQDPSNQAYFEVDFQAHPWLGGDRRRARPWYPLEGDWSYWSKYESKRVRISVRARAIVLVDEKLNTDFNLSLRQFGNVPIDVMQ